MPSIFINYRREDSAGVAGRLADRLIADLGSKKVFMDVDQIPAGVDFVSTIENAVRRADVMLVVIGRSWSTVVDERGVPRLDGENDFVRLEILQAMKGGIPIIPVLVDRAGMPRAQDLPESLAPLVRLNAVTLSHERFHADVSDLIKAIARRLEALAEERARAREAQARAQSATGFLRPPSRVHQQLIGYLSIVLGPALMIMAAMRPTPGVDSEGLVPSLGAYYYTAGGGLFIGAFLALAVLLFTYRGYEGSVSARVAGIVGGMAAVGVALFPTTAPAGLPAAAWWSPSTGMVHAASTALLFVVFMYFAGWVFRRVDVADADLVSPGQRVRRWVQLACFLIMGLAIAGASVSIFVAPGSGVFWFEDLALSAAGASWLVEGRAHEPLLTAVRRATRARS